MAGGVVGLGHDQEDNPGLGLGRKAARRIALSVLVCSLAVFVASVAVLRLPPDHAPLLAPVVLAFGGASLTLLSIRARERAERDDL